MAVTGSMRLNVLSVMELYAVQAFIDQLELGFYML
jgi:hypothetical protein